ncbi:MAG: hypothetical protein Tsb0020_54090 [Haliangiales bacterium]
MTFEWRQYLEVAESLASNGGEANERSAVSRAYYSVFCSARNWLHENQPTLRMRGIGGSHKQVWDEFDHRHNTRERKQIATVGRRLLKARHAVDYNDRVGDTAKKSQEAIRNAKTVLTLLAAL